MMIVRWVPSGSKDVSTSSPRGSSGGQVDCRSTSAIFSLGFMDLVRVLKDFHVTENAQSGVVLRGRSWGSQGHYGLRNDPSLVDRTSGSCSSCLDPAFPGGDP